MSDWLPEADVLAKPCAVCGKPYCDGEARSRLADRWAHSECSKWSDTYETRPCEECGYRRKVKVTHYPLEQMTRHARTCTACDLESSAARHMHQAKALLAEANAIRAKRKEKKQ